MARLTAAPPRLRAAARASAALAVLAGTVAVVGSDPFVHGIVAVTPPSVAGAVGLAAVATVLSAWLEQVSYQM